ncbi:hypothetical protein MYCOZU2_04922 [Mycobacterium intracellulare subsp. chimaera]|uniref:Uncharacterized protein n=1 Tax=Mycobacterium intracellulare subsp. chimaera TaxID=222805 RepID=A0A7U5MPG2_MYCIT|nr:hypothetical protein MYCOZU2_04922 [Mycobacterium intracellulare subsp. chimaera]ASQ88245.1 hypothetical protein CE197_23580 [Mycobacterium intracellulare subsp. chimaera]BCO85916.1 hypothetical protein MINTM011_42510 [Mycobacterium paraintracellulare]
MPGRGSHNYKLDAEGYWRLGDENGLRLTSHNSELSMTFNAEQHYRIIECDPEKHDPELGWYRVTTRMYAYELLVNDTKVWAMHWHPDGQGGEFRPHYHLSGSDHHPFSVKDHLPSGRHTIEDAVEWCVRHGAVPADPNWEAVIAETKGVHVLHRSWSMSPDEPHG